MDQVSDGLIPLLEVGAFPPIRKKKANGWATELAQILAVIELVQQAGEAVPPAGLAVALQHPEIFSFFPLRRRGSSHRAGRRRRQG